MVLELLLIFAFVLNYSQSDASLHKVSKVSKPFKPTLHKRANKRQETTKTKNKIITSHLTSETDNIFCKQKLITLFSEIYSI